MNVAKVTFIAELGDFSDNPANSSLSSEEKRRAALSYQAAGEAKLAFFRALATMCSATTILIRLQKLRCKLCLSTPASLLTRPTIPSMPVLFNVKIVVDGHEMQKSYVIRASVQ